MSDRGRGGFNNNRGRGGYNDRGGRGGYNNNNNSRGNFKRDFAPSGPVVEIGKFSYLCRDTAVYKLTSKEVPLTQTFLFDSKNNKLGKIADVFGPLDNVFFNLEPNEKSFLNSLKEGDKIYAPNDRLRSESFFLDDSTGKKPRGGSRGGRGGRGGNRGGNRGGGRGRY